MPKTDLEEPASMLRWSGVTDVGRYRKNNEDAFLALAVDAKEVRFLGKYGEAKLASCDYIFAVSDGMGGANAGEFASRVAVNKLTELLPKSFHSAAMGIEVGFQDLLAQLFDEIHDEMAHMGRCYEELSGMGATLTLCWVRPDWLYFAHIGDSRLYRLPKDGGIRQLSEDHTHVGWLQRQGKLNERQARSHPGRNGLQQVLGGKNQSPSPQFGAVGYDAGDRFLICSDGLVEGLWDRGMDRLIRKGNPMAKELNPAESLVAEAVKTDGKDNTTALVLELES